MDFHKLKNLILDYLICNLEYDSYVDEEGNAITEIDYDKSAKNIVKAIVEDLNK